MNNHTRPTRIVLVENEVNNFVGGDGDLARVLSKSANVFPYVLCHVQHVREMFSLSSCNEFDVLLLDVSLGESNSFAALERICEAFSAAPVILMVEKADETIRRQAFNLGALDVVERSSLNGELLVERIHSAINRKKEELGRQQQSYWENALTFIQHSASITSARLSPESLGMKPLREAMPYKFLELTKSYSNVLALADTRRTHNGTRFNGHSVSQKLHFLASDLCSLKAGVWDVIDIHAKAVEQRIENQQKEETRQVLLELVTDLVSYYRSVDYANA
jgi:DNA-binding response OmpR family regulator